MNVISAPELNTYGRYARASLLADYIELLALKGQAVKLTTLADFLADNNWNLELIQLPEFDHPSADSEFLSDQLDEAHEVASAVFRQIDERRDVLAERYPFEVTDGAIVLKCRVDLNTSAYAAVLALTITHAFCLNSIHPPDRMFENIVLKALQNRGLPSAGIAMHRRGMRSFEQAVQTACEKVGLKASPNAVPRRVWAHDEGVDILCHIGWEKNLRPGSWAFIGQVTVGSSDNWLNKIREPAPNQWKSFIGTMVPPSPFLAVPHHVERQTMELLTSKSDAIVLDRLRIVRFKNHVQADEQDLIRTIIRADVEPLLG